MQDHLPAAHRRRWTRPALLVLLSIGALLLLLGLNLRRGLNHDEHQFIAAGKLMAAGLRPYADFPYFHLPGLALIDAALFARLPALLLSARLISILWGWLALVVLFALAYRRLPKPVRLVAASALVTLLLAAPLFVHTSGRAWNHDLPVLLLLLAALAYERGLTQRAKPEVASSPAKAHPSWQRYLWLFLCGALLGLATSVRLSFALMAPAFGLALLLHQLWRADRPANPTISWRQWLVDGLFLALGWAVGLAPVFPFAWQAPAAFWFGNIDYIRLNTAYYRSVPGASEAMTPAGKLAYLVRMLTLQPADLLAVAGLCVALWPARAKPASSANDPITQPPDLESWRVWRALLPLLLFFALLGGLAATPSQEQYFYPLLPLIILSAIVGLASQPLISQRQRTRWLAGIAGLAALLALPSYAPGLAILPTPAKWAPWQLHTRSTLLATLVDGGTVLSLAPVSVLESGAAIEPALATGPFAWRVAKLVDPARRAQFGLLGPADLSAYWSHQPPRALLVGVHSDDAADEAPLVAQAQTSGYVPVRLPDETTLWLSPLATWGETIRLGGHTLPRQPVPPGAEFVATFYLQATRPITTNLNVLLRLVDQQGGELVRSEGWPWGAATSGWEPGAVWPDGHDMQLPANAAPGVYRAEMSFYDPATLETLGDVATVGYLVVGEPVAETPPPLAEFGGQLQLLGARINAAQQPGQAGNELVVELTWQASSRPQADYTTFIHLLGPDGEIIAQQDQPPLAGFYPTHWWRPGIPVTDTIQLALPPGDPPDGPLRLVLGLYEPTSGQRLPITVAGAPIGDAFEVGEIQAPR